MYFEDEDVPVRSDSTSYPLGWVQEEEVNPAKEKKRERARAYARRKAKELSFVEERAVLIYNELVRLGVYNQLSDEAKEFFNIYKHREHKAAYPYPNNMYKMFGKLIAPGAQVTLQQAMNRLYKGKNEINMLCRRWTEKHGVQIECIPDENGDELAKVYKIVKIDTKKVDDPVEDISEILSNKERRELEAFNEGE